MQILQLSARTIVIITIRSFPIKDMLRITFLKTCYFQFFLLLMADLFSSTHNYKTYYQKEYVTNG